MLKNTNLVEKSKPLVWARFNNYNTNELKLLEVYLSRINARDPESSCVTFTKKEYCELMGVSPDLMTSRLKKYTRSFLGNVVTIDTESGYRQFTLFSDAVCEMDKELGQVVIRIDCNPKLRDVFFNIAEDGYIRYKLRNIVNLNSQYSIRLYSLLKDKAFGNYEWVAELKELRELLGATEKSYESFKEFNRRVLSKAEEEINEHTDIRFTWEKVTKGRLTKAVRFKIQQLDEKNLPGQMNIYDFPEYLPDEPEAPADPMSEKYSFWAGACEDEFNHNQIKELSVLASTHIEFTFDVHDRDRMMYDYLRRKYIALANKKDVKSRFGYMKYLVENDC